MKKLLLFSIILLGCGLISCGDDTIDHPFMETYTDADGKSYRVFHLEVSETLEPPLTNFESVELKVMNMVDNTVTEMLLARDKEKSNCLVFFVPEGFVYKVGLFRTYQALQNGRVFTLPLEIECSSDQLVGCRILTEEVLNSYENKFTFNGDSATAGTASNPYLITEFEDLRTLRTCVENDLSRGAGRYFKQTASIRVDDMDLPSGEMGWRPIGFVKNVSEGFAGHYDGNKQTIEGMHIYDMGADYLGLFSSLLAYATVKDLKIKDFTIDSKANSYIGALCGAAMDEVVITNVDVENCNLSGTGRIGGVVGDFRGTSMTDCLADRVVIKATSDCVGAIAGSINGRLPVTFTNCSNDGASKLEANSSAGGIIGEVYGTLMIKKSRNRAYSITANKQSAGGLIGFMRGTLTMTDCENDLDVEGNQQDHISLRVQGAGGGLIGWLDAMAEESVITNCKSSAAIHVEEDCLGGLIGQVSGTGSLRMVNPLCGLEGVIAIDGNYAGGLIGRTLTETIIETTQTKANNANINSQGGYVGGIVGATSKKITLTGVQSHGAITAKGNYVGGLIGHGEGEVILNNSCMINAVTIKGGGYVGGLIGSFSNGTLHLESTTDKSLFNGLVNQESDLSAPYCGGILGYGKDLSIEFTRVLSTGKVSGSTDVGGLIGKIENGRKVWLDGCVVSGDNGIVGKSYIGGLIGTLYSKDIYIKGCVNKAPVKGSGDVTGGIVGCLESKGSTQTLITGSNNEGKIAGNNTVGGIVAKVDNPQTSDTFAFNYCINTGAISGATNVGGCIGLIKESTFAHLDQLSNRGSISVSNPSSDESGTNNVGGVLARNYSDLNIQYCNNSGDITTNGSYYVGGIVGRMGEGGEHYNNLKLDRSYNTGKITANGHKKLLAGGIAGKIENVNPNSGIRDCYNTAEVSAPDYEAGIVGYTDWGVDVDRCYYYGPKINNGIVARGSSRAQTYRDNRVLDGTPTGFSNKDKAKNLSAADFAKQDKFGGWNFNEAWTWGGTPNNSRPVLRNNVE